jgi:TPR repeat protein
MKKLMVVTGILAALLLPSLACGADSNQAFTDMQKAAEKGDAASQYSLGVMYERGRGVPQDYVKAVEWYQKAADQGYAKAQYGLGLMYDNGYGVERSRHIGCNWLRKAGDQGHEDAIKAIIRFCAQ